MPRKPRTRSDIMRRYEKLDDLQLIEAVCNRFCQGKSASLIREEIEQELGRSLSREQPYQILAFAGLKNWLQFNPPLEYALAQQLTWKYAWLQGVDVIKTRALEHVAARAARVLLHLVRQIAHNKSTVHVGLAGGWTVLQTVRYFAELLSHPMEDLPSELCFHAMVTGLQLHHPQTDPNTFFNYLWALPVKTKFVALHGPVLPSTKMINELMEEHGPTRRAFREGAKIDIIVTSGSSWLDQHSQLKDLIQTEFPDEVQKLEEKGCVGDILWQAIKLDGAIENETQVQAMTLTKLNDLPDAIGKGTKVLLVLGPCGRCGRPRDDLLRIVVNLKTQYVTHLVTDFRTANISSEAERQGE